MLRKLGLSFIFISTLLFSAIANADTVDSLFRHPGDPIGGNAGGNITVVEFFDYNCSHCISMAPTMSNMIKTNPNVRVVYKELPIRGESSLFASRAALAANMQGKYVAMHNALLTADAALTDDAILDIAKKLGLNIQKLKTDMNSDQVSSQIDFDLYLSSYLKIPGTPAFYIGKTNAKTTQEVQYMPGELNTKQLQDAINEAAK